MARPRQHHYVTRAYLEGFLEPPSNQIFCYGRRRHRVFWSRPEDLAKQRDYYSFKRPDGSWDDMLEHLLDEKIESPGISVLRKLVGGDTRLSWADRQHLSMFIATQRMRVPYFREMLDANYKQLVHQLRKDYEEKERELGFSPGPMRFRSVGPFDDGADGQKRRPSNKRGTPKNSSIFRGEPGSFQPPKLLGVCWVVVPHL